MKSKVGLTAKKNSEFSQDRYSKLQEELKSLHAELQKNSRNKAAVRRIRVRIRQLRRELMTPAEAI